MSDNVRRLSKTETNFLDKTRKGNIALSGNRLAVTGPDAIKVPRYGKGRINFDEGNIGHGSKGIKVIKDLKK